LPSRTRQARKAAPPIPPAAEAADGATEETAEKPSPVNTNGDPLASDQTALPNEKDLETPPAELPPVKALPPPSDVEAAPAKLDDSVVQAQNPAPPPQNPAAPPKPPGVASAPGAMASDGSNLPAARGSVAGAPAESAASSEVESFVLPPDVLQTGRQSVALSIEVIGPEILNIQQEAKLKIVVKNTGTADALGVVVRDDFPAALELLSSQPNQEPSSGAQLVWKLGTVPANSERLITLNVKATHVGEINHAATVSMKAGSKAHTIVRRPLLKVEQRATSGRVVKGRPVEFLITVKNIGDGLARNVIVQAKLSPGLRVVSADGNNSNLFETTVEEDLEPGRTIELLALQADTILGGEQSCQVVAHSPDVQPDLEGSKSTKTVTIIEPKLKLSLTGDEKRFTDTLASYVVSLENPGTASTRNIQVSVTLNTNGRPQLPIPANGRWDPSQRRITWSIPQLEPGDPAKERLDLPFQVLMGSPGTFQVTAEAKAPSLYDKANLTTTIDGMPMVDLEVEQSTKRIVDVNVPVSYKIRIRNTGTKEATNILVKALPSTNLAVDRTRGTEQAAGWSESQKAVVWPVIPRLEPGKELSLGIQVHGTKAGQASCRVFVTHDKDEGDQLEDAAYTRITETRRR